MLKIIKNPIKNSHGREKGRPKKSQKDEKLVGTKEGRELVLLVVGSYLTCLMKRKERHHVNYMTMKPNQDVK